MKEEIENDFLTKASQYRSFILSYSRIIMLFYNKILDVDLNKFIVAYTDTDSLHIPIEYCFMLKNKNLIRNREL